MAGPVRQQIDLKALESYLEKNVPEIKVPLKLKQFGFGQSNPTYLITASNGNQYVMRKKPPGKLLSQTAHRVDREYRIIHALEPTDVPVPRALCLCEDDSIIGTPFYIMSFLDGRMVTEPHFPGFSEQERNEMWHDAVRTLAKFHRVKPDNVGLGNFGKHTGFYDRQLKTFGTIAKAQAQTKDVETKEPVGDIPHFNDMITFFRNKQRQPKDRTTLIHGDYKIDNLVFHKTEPRVIGILDWEMATIGHPLSDLANLVGPYTWTTATKGTDGKSAAGAVKGGSNFQPGATPGLPTLEQVVQWYAEESGYNPGQELAWGNAFAGFRGAVIMQGIAARYAQRQASSASAREYGEQMMPYGEWAWSTIEKLKDSQGAKTKL